MTSSFEHQSVADFDGKSKTPSTPKPSVKIPKTGKASTLIATSVVNIADEFQLHMQKNYFGLFALAFLSKAFVLSSVALSRSQPYERLSQLVGNSENKLKMPVPMVTVLQSGKGFSGKQNLIKEFILMPKPNTKTHDVSMVFF